MVRCCCHAAGAQRPRWLLDFGQRHVYSEAACTGWGEHGGQTHLQTLSEGTMTTLGQAVSNLERELFVGRVEELAAFRQWLTDTCALPDILNVSGPGGVGKSATLNAFVREAETLGRRTLLVDARGLRGTRRSLLGAFGGSGLDAVVERLHRAQPILLLDSFEELAQVADYVRTRLLPRV